MIIIAKKGEAPISKPPETKFGSYSDSANFYYFETQEEVDAFKRKAQSEASVVVSEDEAKVEEAKKEIEAALDDNKVIELWSRIISLSTSDQLSQLKAALANVK